MQIKIYTVPIVGPELFNEEMNKFLGSHKVLNIDQSIIQQESGAYWTFCIRYLGENALPANSPREKVDYKTVLSESAFLKFSVLREARKSIAKEEAIPAYAVFTDAELAELAQLPELNVEAMKRIPGIGTGKIERYANRILGHYQGTCEEKRVFD